MAYGLKLFSPWGFVTFDENYRYNNNVLAGITVIPAGPAGTRSPFIGLAEADNADKYLIFASSLYTPSFYTPIIGENGFRWRSAVESPADIIIDYLVMRIG